jgi:choline dehydrogenase-like flavoprotein
MPLANLKWTFSDEDRASVLRFFELLEREMQADDIARMEYGRLRNADEWPLIGIHSHFMGTTRMGDDPRTSVTTRDCRIHDCQNVFVAGPSLFPTYGYANPVYTIVALSLRLADHLQSLPAA